MGEVAVDFPVAPVIAGLILGPLTENQFRRVLSISQGDPGVFATHSIFGVRLALALLVLLGPWAWRRIRNR